MNSSLVLFILGYFSYASGLLTCNNYRTCGECIGHSLEKCVWCAESSANIENRCQPENSHLTNYTWCKKEYIFNPNETKIDVQNDNFSPTVQFRPQKIKIKARPGVIVNLTLSYKSADDFPLDVYFVMDYSYTMKAHKAELEKQALTIYDGLKKLTNNVRLGVGSFVEKPGLPYADIHEHTTYAFKNHLALTDNMTAFEDVIKKSQFGSNYDSAEAGLDALMQIMTCESKLNWRNYTRRIIVLATDSTYHSAGDGKMLGAIKPNDMQCHLDGNEYNREIALTHDYPSVSLISKVAGKGNFKVIFAALHKVKDVYEALAKQILGAKYAELKEKSNILQIIKTAYEESIQHVEIDYHTTSAESIQLKIDQDCQSNPTVNCESSPKKPIVSIPVFIKSTRCPDPNANNHLITINPLGLNEKLTISFEVDCQCECEKNVSSVKSEKCNSLGTFQCGTCKCDENRGGDSCQYNCSNEVATNLTQCIQSNFTKVCNNHGTCRCGRCDCDPNYSGMFCQYDDTSCPTKNGMLCAGHGKCTFATCKCSSGWIGVDCECPDHDRHCIGPFSSKVCSGRGKCECGECICDKIQNKTDTYLGTFCDSCDECAIERCEEFKEYAHCNHKLEKDVCDKTFNLTKEIEVIVANSSELVNTTNWKLGTQCRTELEDGNFLLFKYKAIRGTHRVLLMIQKEVELPDKAKVWTLIGSVIAGILLIGLLTAVFWKILVDMYDKREYEKFCNEAKSQGYDVSENPLYEPPTQNFVNPGFNRNVHE